MSRQSVRSPGRRGSLGALAVAITMLLLLATGAILLVEQAWVRPKRFLSGQATFVAGSIGTEFMPLPVLEVLPDIDPEAFPPPSFNSATKAWEGGWIARYGFLERRGFEEVTIPATERELADILRTDADLAALPVGFTLAYTRPFTPDPSPVRFVGLACAGCHSTRLPDRGPTGKLVYGAGNSGLDLIGFFEAFRGALLKKKIKDSVPADRRANRSITEGPDLDASDYEYAVSLASVKAARQKRSLPALTFAEELMVRLWLANAQGLAQKNTMKYDLPATAQQLRSPQYNGVGPGRTQPFVTLDNEVLNLPAKDNRGYSKIPAVFREGDREWAQFDGSVRDHHTRSGLAAMTAGGSVDNLGGLGVGHDIMAAADYTRTQLAGPRWQEIFGKPPGGAPAPNPTDAEAALLDVDHIRGREVYSQHCASCHGRPDPEHPGRWLTDPDHKTLFGKIVPAINPFTIDGQPLADWVKFPNEAQWAQQHTDPERVVFRDSRVMPYVLFTYFDRNHPHKTTGEYYPLEHPLAIVRDRIRSSGGYVNAPLDSLFTRAPYLHNGSVPTLAQLINLEPRPTTFLRGKNLYDPDKAGIVVPDGKPAQTNEDLYWTFDTTQRGNLNTGHNYPWAFDDKDRDEKALRDLLEYLKTF